MGSFRRLVEGCALLDIVDVADEPICEMLVDEFMCEVFPEKGGLVAFPLVRLTMSGSVWTGRKAASRFGITLEKYSVQTEASCLKSASPCKALRRELSVYMPTEVTCVMSE
jgi:hypothetical protein